MKKILALAVLLASGLHVSAQDGLTGFPAADFAKQLDKLICTAKTGFAEVTVKAVIVSGDTTWKSTLALPGFKFSNLGKNRSAIDMAFVAYQPFESREAALKYFEEVKQALNALPATGCLKIQQSGMPMVVQGVEKYEVWKSAKAAGYSKAPNALLNVTLSLDGSNDVTINMFLK